jgi:hypothetical protein
MQILEGHLFMADLTGYTAFMTASELEHAGPILSGLLGAVIENIQAPLEIANLEGDAVFFWAPTERFVSGQTLLELCERVYFAFADLRRQMIANTTCPCRACANIPGLDLKIFAHYGKFQVLELAGRRELSGPDVILLHRMTKTDIRSVLDIPCYLLLTRAEAERTGVDHDTQHLTRYSENFEHFGDVDLVAHDLGAAWAAFQSAAEPIYISKEEAFWSGEIALAGDKTVIWDYLVLPEHKKAWMDMVSVDVSGGPATRHGIGTEYHCVHTDVDVRFKIVDWRPFDYFSAVEVDPMGSGLVYRETWEIAAADDGYIVRFNVDAPFPAEGRDEPATEEERLAIRGLYEAYGMPMLEGLKAYMQT